MKIKEVLNAILMCIFGLFSLSAHAYYLEDTFETGDWSTTNADGFEWGGNKNRTSIVKQDKTNGNMLLCYGAVFDKGLCPIDEVVNDGKNWTAKNGSNSMRVRYPSQMELDAGAEPWAEQRYDMGMPLGEVWTSFWLRVPDNFSARVTGKDNSKVFALWMGAYLKKDVGTTVVVNMWSRPDGGTDLGISGEYFVNGTGHFVTSATGLVPFIAASDAGKWMHLILKVIHETSIGARDGTWAIYRRWEDENIYTKLKEDTGLDIPLPVSGIPAGFKAGYLLGWSNPSYLEETEFLLDDFIISDESQLRRPKPPVVEETK